MAVLVLLLLVLLFCCEYMTAIETLRQMRGQELSIVWRNPTVSQS